VIAPSLHRQIDGYGPAVLDLIGLIRSGAKGKAKIFPSYICRMEYVCVAVVAFICRYGRGIV
jgi:hypothetical protein